MDDVTLSQVRAQLTRHEGVRLHPYTCTAGALTIGIGRNLDDRGITMTEAQQMLSNDLDHFVSGLSRAWPEWDSARHTPARQAVVLNMAFNLGINRLMLFRRMRGAYDGGDYERASIEMLDSRWADQVGRRATELAQQMRTGQWQGAGA